MLVAFLKTDHAVNASIVKFEDRIWINENGDGEVSRRFWVKVEEDSSPLSTMRCFISRKPVKDIKILCEHGDSRSYPFNDRERYTGIVDIVKGRDKNIIDGIQYRICKINEKSVELVEVGEGISLDINFSGVPLNPGSTYLVPIKFTVQNLFDLSPLKTLGEAQFVLCYFVHPSLEDMFLCIEESMVIPVVPILPNEDGGFAVFIYAPPTYQLIAIDRDLIEVHVNHDYQGNPIDTRGGLFLELCDVMRRRSIDPLRERIVFANKKYNHNLEVHGKIVERVYASELKKQISELRKKVTRPNKYTWIAIGLGAAGLIASIYFNFFS